MAKVNSVIVAIFGYKNDMTVDELATYFGITTEELKRNVFSGREDYDINIIKKIADKLNLSISDLLK